jgi:peptidoglycan/xylan/chitin deacetylase (PgdA/CDA1 family)
VKRHFRSTVILFTILISLFTGCTSIPRSISPGIANANTPEPVGGSELQNRTGEHAYKVDNIVFFEGPSTLKQAALTFDDGPDVYYTTKILDILSKNKIRATFFIVGQRAEKHPEIIKRIVNDGHTIGNHSWDHPDLNKLTPEKVKFELDQTSNLLCSITGFQTHLFRPPYGAASQSVVNELASMGYKVIDWSVDTRDWAGTPPAIIMEYVKKELKPGGIILEHCAGGKNDNLDNTVKALPEIISYAKNQGYTFVTIPELLGLPK